MSEATTPLGSSQLAQIGTYVKDHLNGWLAERGTDNDSHAAASQHRLCV